MHHIELFLIHDSFVHHSFTSSKTFCVPLSKVMHHTELLLIHESFLHHTFTISETL